MFSAHAFTKRFFFFPEILLPWAHRPAVTQETLTRSRTSQIRTSRQTGQSADTCPAWSRLLLNQLSGLPAFSQRCSAVPRGMRPVPQTHNPVGALYRLSVRERRSWGLILCFHINTPHNNIKHIPEYNRLTRWFRSLHFFWFVIKKKRFCFKIIRSPEKSHPQCLNLYSKLEKVGWSEPLKVCFRPKPSW